MYNEYGDWYYFKRPYLSYSCLIDELYEQDLYDTVSAKWQKTNPAITNLIISKEEKKMHKKQKVNGHVVHKLPRCENLYYTVEPENSRICVHKLAYVDQWTLEPHYNFYGYMNICTKQLGRHGYLEAQIAFLSLKYSDITPIRDYVAYEKLTREDLKALNNTIFKEEKKMGEIKKDRITLDASEDCQLELFKDSNMIVFHFGTESQVVTVPDDYEIDWGIKEMGTCDLHIKKKKPKLLNMKFTVKARPIFRQKYANTASDDICDYAAVSFPEPYEGASICLVIKDGVVSTLSSDDELLAYNVGIWIPNRLGYTMDDIPFIERKIREAYNTRKIFPNATNGIEIIKEER